MFHYHKKTHNSIESKMCEHGCNKPALFISTSGKYSCSEKFQFCKGYIRLQAERVTNQWASNKSDQRKIDARESFIKRLHNEETYKKQSRTKRLQTGLLTEEKRKDFRAYARSCRKLSQLWAKDNGHETGRQTFHVDHIYSVLDGFKNEVPPSIISHPCNLRILEAKKNSSKGRNSEITLEELYEKINPPCEQVESDAS